MVGDVADRECARAIRRAVIGEGGGASVQRDETGARLLNAQILVDDLLAVGVDDDEVGPAERLTGNDKEFSTLYRYVGD